MLGEHSQIASLKAQLAEAKYNLEQTIVRAPSDGYVTQVLIRPGTYAASLPLRPVMVFIPDQKRQIVAQFRQNSLLRLAPGDDAEVVFNALPGKVFSGKLAAISPAVPGGAYQSTGTLQTLNTAPGSDGVIATIELDEHTDLSALPDGIYAQVAVYSDHFSHVSVMRKVLLRMTSWVHYLISIINLRFPPLVQAAVAATEQAGGEFHAAFHPAHTGPARAGIPVYGR